MRTSRQLKRDVCPLCASSDTPSTFCLSSARQLRSFAAILIVLPPSALYTKLTTVWEHLKHRSNGRNIIHIIIAGMSSTIPNRKRSHQSLDVRSINGSHRHVASGLRREQRRDETSGHHSNDHQSSPPRPKIHSSDHHRHAKLLPVASSPRRKSLQPSCCTSTQSRNHRRQHAPLDWDPCGSKARNPSMLGELGVDGGRNQHDATRHGARVWSVRARPQY